MSKEYIEINKDTFPTPYKNVLNDFMRGWNACLNSVMQHKVADVAPVKHGEWLKHNGYKECSLCGFLAYNPSNYCSNCGADMRGENK